jgi:hypothetical protein
VSVLVLLLQQYLSRGHERQQATARRLADFSAASWSLTLELGRFARAPMEEKAARETELERHGDRTRAALALIQLLDDNTVYRAAAEVYHQLFELHNAGRERVWTREDWREARRPLSRAVVAFQSASRSALGSSTIDLAVRGAEPGAASGAASHGDVHVEPRPPVAGREAPTPGPRR